MKSDIAQIRRKTWKNNFEGLDGTIQVHVKDSILIVPHSGSWASYLVTDEQDPIVTRIGLNLLTVAPVAAHAWIAGCIRTVEPTGGKLKNVGPPVTEN